MFSVVRLLEAFRVVGLYSIHTSLAFGPIRSDPQYGWESRATGRSSARPMSPMGFCCPSCPRIPTCATCEPGYRRNRARCLRRIRLRARRRCSLAHLKRLTRAFERFTTPPPLLDPQGRHTRRVRASPSVRPRLQDDDFELPTTLPRRGLVKVVSFTWSDRTLKILGFKTGVPKALVHRYVTATCSFAPRGSPSGPELSLARGAHKLTPNF